jgi:hypothetical protein
VRGDLLAQLAGARGGQHGVSAAKYVPVPVGGELSAI